MVSDKQLFQMTVQNSKLVTLRIRYFEYIKIQYTLYYSFIILVEFSSLLQTTKIPYQCSERILDALADVVKSVGELSLLSADCFEDSYATVLPPCEVRRLSYKFPVIS